ncbi:putative isomerase YbhE [Thelephora ganbajun]|uniref:Isomerase YbhE n=1 Tax=Thelephora ganbajun TaxID=370292 RepID=A0ACB6Z9K7_THEGA|nr:putative isomerase YbhE [Thelephora ganbajun]
MAYRILTATYTDKIETLSFDSETKSLSITSSLIVGHHPSWITPHPEDPAIWFTALEQEDGRVVAIEYDKEGKGKVVKEVPSEGAEPCTLVVYKGDLLIGNYSGGNVVALPLTSSPPYVAASTTKLSLSGSGPDPDRQLSSHPHQVIPHPTRDELFVSDLGDDKTLRLAKSADGVWEIRGHISYNGGSGPRHVAFYGDNVYTILELTSFVAAHKVPPLPADPIFLISTPTKRNPFPYPNQMLAAEILVPIPNEQFPTPYLYVSNRNDPSPEGDTISIFAIANDALDLISEVSTGLNHVRGMAFGGPDSEWLVAGGTNGGGVKIFRRVEGGKNLKQIAHDPSVQSPTGFAWL